MLHVEGFGIDDDVVDLLVLDLFQHCSVRFRVCLSQMNFEVPIMRGSHQLAQFYKAWKTRVNIQRRRWARS